MRVTIASTYRQQQSACQSSRRAWQDANPYAVGRVLQRDHPLARADRRFGLAQNPQPQAEPPTRNSNWLVIADPCYYHTN